MENKIKAAERLLQAYRFLHRLEQGNIVLVCLDGGEVEVTGYHFSRGVDVSADLKAQLENRVVDLLVELTS